MYRKMLEQPANIRLRAPPPAFPPTGSSSPFRRSFPPSFPPLLLLLLFSPSLLLPTSLSSPLLAFAQPAPTVKVNYDVSGLISAEDLSYCESLISEYDSNSDGSVDAAEFSSFVFAFSGQALSGPPPLIVRETYDLIVAESCASYGLCAGLATAASLTAVEDLTPIEYFVDACARLSVAVETALESEAPTAAPTVRLGEYAVPFGVRVFYAEDPVVAQIANDLTDDVRTILADVLEKQWGGGTGSRRRRLADVVRYDRIGDVRSEEESCDSDASASFCSVFTITPLFFSNMDLPNVEDSIKTDLVSSLEDASSDLLSNYTTLPTILKITFLRMGLPETVKETPILLPPPNNNGIIAVSLVAAAALFGAGLMTKKFRHRKQYYDQAVLDAGTLGASGPDYYGDAGTKRHTQPQARALPLPRWSGEDPSISFNSSAAGSSARRSLYLPSMVAATEMDPESEISSSGWSTQEGDEGYSIRTEEMDEMTPRTAVGSLAAFGIASGVTRRMNRRSVEEDHTRSQNMLSLDNEFDDLEENSIYSSRSGNGPQTLRDDDETGMTRSGRMDVLPEANSPTLSQHNLELAIESHDWAAVGATAALLAESDASLSLATDLTSRRSRSTFTSWNTDGEVERVAELDRLVEEGDWEGVVLAAARFEQDGSRSQPSEEEEATSSLDTEGESEGPPAPVVVREAAATPVDEDPSGDSRTSSQGQKQRRLRDQVEELVKRVVPEEIENVDEMMSQFAGREEELIETLRSMQERQIAGRARRATNETLKRDIQEKVFQTPSPNTEPTPPQANSFFANLFGGSNRNLQQEEKPAALTPARDMASPVSAVSSALPSTPGNDDAGPSISHSPLDNAIRAGEWDKVVLAASNLQDADGQQEGGSNTVFSGTTGSILSATYASAKTNSSGTMTGGRAAELDRLIEQGDWNGIIETANKYKEIDLSKTRLGTGVSRISTFESDSDRQHSTKYTTSMSTGSYGTATSAAPSPTTEELSSSQQQQRFGGIAIVDSTSGEGWSSGFSQDRSNGGNPGKEEDLREEQDALKQAEMWATIAAQTEPDSNASSNLKGASDAADWAISRRFEALQSQGKKNREKDIEI